MVKLDKLHNTIQPVGPMTTKKLYDNLMSPKIEVIQVLKRIAPSKMTRKYNKTLKALPMLVWTKYTTLGGCLEAKISLPWSTARSTVLTCFSTKHYWRVIGGCFNHGQDLYLV